MANRTVKVDVKGDVSDFNRAMLAASASSKAFADSLDSSRNQMSRLVQAGLAFGPAFLPVAAQAIPVVTGLANQLGIAGAAAGVTAVAFNGVGEALTNLNKYRLDPTATNLDNLTDSMASIGPAGREFVLFLQDLRPEVEHLQNISQEGIFPGLQEGLTELTKNGPLIEDFFTTVSQTVGDLFAEAGDNLNDPRWQEFFEFLIREARPTLEAMGRTIGNFTEGLAEMWMAFEPLNDRFSAGFLEMSRDFADWAGNLSQSGGFQDFIAYIVESGPMVADMLGSIGNALVELAKAGAEVGAVAMPVLTVLADAFAGLMGSPIGPTLLGIAAGLAAISTAMAVGRFMNIGAIGAAIGVLRDLPMLGRGLVGFGDNLLGVGKRFDSFGGSAVKAQEGITRMNKAMRLAAVGGAGAGLLALTMSDLDDKMGLAHTSSFALMGLIAGPWGAAIGAGVGLAMDFAATNDNMAAALDRAAASAGNASVAFKQQAADQAAALEQIRKIEAETPSFGGFDVAAGKDISFAGIKNAFEGLFGKSDTEEARAALKEIEATTQAAKFAQLGLTDAMAGASASIRDKTEALYDEIAAQRQSNSETLSSIGGEIAYEAAVDNATKTIRENGRATDLTKEAGRENTAAIMGMIGAWNDLDPAAQKARGGVDKARKAVYDAAIAAGFGKKEARAFADMLIDLGGINARPRVTLEGVDGAVKKLNHVRQRLLSLDGMTARTFVQIKESVATGGRLGPGYARGGVVPGVAPADPTVDNVMAYGYNTGTPIMVRSGEWIINQRQSEKNDAWLRAINNGLNLGPYPRFAPGYAGGGVVGGDGASAPTGLGVTQHIYPQPGQSEQEIGKFASDRLLWALETS